MSGNDGLTVLDDPMAVPDDVGHPGQVRKALVGPPFENGDVGQFARFDRPDLIAHVEDLRVRFRRRGEGFADRIARRHELLEL